MPKHLKLLDFHGSMNPGETGTFDDAVAARMLQAKKAVEVPVPTKEDHQKAKLAAELKASAEAAQEVLAEEKRNAEAEEKVAEMTGTKASVTSETKTEK